MKTGVEDDGVEDDGVVTLGARTIREGWRGHVEHAVATLRSRS